MNARRTVHVTRLLVVTVLCGFILASSNVGNITENQKQDSNISTYKITVLTIASLSSCDKKFLSVAIDTNTVIKYWSGFNFSSTKMQNVAKALAPCDLRVGGIMADFLDFVPDNNTSSQNVQDDSIDDLNVTYDETSVQQIQQPANHIIIGEQWDQLTTFLKTVGWGFIFDFNVFKRKNGLWDPSNAELLLNYSAARGIPFAGFQLGNEPAHYARLFNISITPSNLSADFKVLKNLISSYPQYKNCSLFGPGVSDGPSSMTYLRQFIAAGGADVLDELEIHHYYMDCRIATVQAFLNVSVLGHLKKVLISAISATGDVSHPLRIRLSETSSCFGGGGQGLSNAYVAGFLWLDKLGLAAQYGFSKVIRQTFIGGRYELVASTTFDPNPDFYLSVLFKRLVEGPVFLVILNPPVEQLRVYANCARRDFFSYPPGALVIYYLNLADEEVVLSMSQFSDANSEVFLLTPGDTDGLNSRFVKLNGQILLMSGDDVPQMLPRHQSGDITVGAQTFGFIVIPLANVHACKKPEDSKPNKSSPRGNNKIAFYLIVIFLFFLN